MVNFLWGFSQISKARFGFSWFCDQKKMTKVNFWGISESETVGRKPFLPVRSPPAIGKGERVATPETSP